MVIKREKSKYCGPVAHVDLIQSVIDPWGRSVIFNTTKVMVHGGDTEPPSQGERDP